MLPEHISLDLEPGRVRRILRKILGKLSDIEEEVALRPSVYKTNSGSHLLPKAHRQPRYTYRRRSGYRSSDGNGSDGSDASIDFTSSTGAKRRGNIGGSKTRAGQFVRSSSLGSLSDSDAAGTSGSTIGKDPALWLTTPRKRPEPGRQSTATFRRRQRRYSPRRRQSLLHHGWRTSFPKGCVSAWRSHSVLRGQRRPRYIDEIYSAIPPFLTRFVLWHHVVAMCYLRTPAYADTLAEALWQVGAVAQQEWLIICAWAASKNMAPLHLRAIDIGTGMRFRRRLAGETTDVHLLATKSLWYQFVPTGCTVNASDEDDSGERAGDGSFSAQMDAAVPSRYAKWVARMGDLAQSTLALDQALQFISLQLSPALENSWLGCMAPDAAMGGIDMAVSGGLWQCLMAQPGRSTMKQGGLGQETLRMCTMYRSGLTLLALRQLKLCALAHPVAKSDLRRLCETIALPNPSAMPLEGGPSRRGLIAARFNSLMESTLHLSGGLTVRGADPDTLLARAVPRSCADIGMDLRCPRVARTIVDLVSLRFDAIWAHHSECSVWQRDWSRLQNTGVCVVDAIPGANGPVASHAAPACVQDESSIVKAGGCGIDDCVYGNSRERALRQLRDRADRATKPAPTESVSIPASAPETASKSALGSSIFGKVEEDELGFMLLQRRRSRANQR
ncbi:hypothetical protein BX661DRAFT_183190 [Kickxella alabastrina]|uniref:uncharacterized protein n=1 Tax=Kickxella alabastrina TaxID=61397 RepID=UPI002220F030|nr:uncharacterized protein BX661DRAFT_183190 [Kickxella alabastrina]KAI7827390.1 hypothetical protein BX661DRAFT_183190 [Kickxella alabastrina]